MDMCRADSPESTGERPGHKIAGHYAVEQRATGIVLQNPVPFLVLLKM
jgi:hypothetical protein